MLPTGKAATPSRCWFSVRTRRYSFPCDWTKAAGDQWQGEEEDRATSWRVFVADGAAHLLDQQLADRKSQSGAALAAAVGRIGLGETLKNARLEFLGNSGAAIAHVHAHCIALHCR